MHRFIFTTSTIRRATFMVRPAIAMVLLPMILSACQSVRSVLPIPASQAGIPSARVLEVSELVSRVRSDYPDLAAREIPHEIRSFGRRYSPPKAVLALRGKGTAVSGSEGLSMKLYLDKDSYSSGQAQLLWEDGRTETVPIVAFDNKGRPDGLFDNIYIFQREDGGLYYFDLVGGEYGSLNIKYVGFEGTLILPGPGNSVKEGATVYKVDFGFRYPLPPEFVAHTNRLNDLTSDLSKGVKTLQSTKADVDKAEEELLSLRNTPPTEAEAPAQEKRIQALEAKARELKASLDNDGMTTESLFSEYFMRRKSFSDSFTAFLESNYYTWITPEEAVDYWKRWRQVQKDDEQIDKAFQGFIDLAQNPERLRGDRRETLQVIERNNNQSLDPLGQ